ncbi:uncharacterized protein TNCV_2165101 [Trichonephila clavipes]|nr:uncharacterized protein TNCV_2165101 [Trichonephila clavipes]
MEQSNKYTTTNADTLTSERERNLAKENGETQQANINDENMQDYDDQQPSEKDIVQPEDISNAPTEECLENVGFTLKSLSQTRWSCHYDVVEALKDNYGNVVVISIDGGPPFHKDYNSNLYIGPVVVYKQRNFWECLSPHRKG